MKEDERKNEGKMRVNERGDEGEKGFRNRGKCRFLFDLQRAMSSPPPSFARFGVTFSRMFPLQQRFDGFIFFDMALFYFMFFLYLLFV